MGTSLRASLVILLSSLVLMDGGAGTPQARSTQTDHAKPARDYPVRPVPFTSVHLHDEFWAPRIEINRTVTIPFAFQKEEETGRIHNFERAAVALKGGELADKKPPGYPFDDS